MSENRTDSSPQPYFERLEQTIKGYFNERRHLTLATTRQDQFGAIRPHASEVWMNVSPQLDRLHWFSGSTRRHSLDIQEPPRTNGTIAYVAGSLAITQAVSQPVLGVTFEARGRVVPAGAERDSIIASWIDEGLFKEDEVATYLQPNKADVPPHRVYTADVEEWRLIDGTQDPRLILFGGTDCHLPPDGTVHTRNPHLHLPLPWER